LRAAAQGVGYSCNTTLLRAAAEGVLIILQKQLQGRGEAKPATDLTLGSEAEAPRRRGGWQLRRGRGEAKPAMDRHQEMKLRLHRAAANPTEWKARRKRDGVGRSVAQCLDLGSVMAAGSAWWRH